MTVQTALVREGVKKELMKVGEATQTEFGNTIQNKGESGVSFSMKE